MDGGRTGEVRVIGASGKACRFLTIFAHVSAGEFILVCSVRFSSGSLKCAARSENQPAASFISSKGKSWPL